MAEYQAHRQAGALPAAPSPASSTTTVPLPPLPFGVSRGVFNLSTSITGAPAVAQGLGAVVQQPVVASSLVVMQPDPLVVQLGPVAVQPSPVAVQPSSIAAQPCSVVVQPSPDTAPPVNAAVTQQGLITGAEGFTLPLPVPNVLSPVSTVQPAAAYSPTVASGQPSVFTFTAPVVTNPGEAVLDFAAAPLQTSTASNSAGRKRSRGVAPSNEGPPKKRHDAGVKRGPNIRTKRKQEALLQQQQQ